MTLLLILSFLVLMLIGVPIALAMAGASLLYVMIENTQPHLVVVYRMISGVDSFPLLAIPFFIMAGSLMNSAGITQRIYDFALALVGWTRGGLGHVNVLGSVIFAGMSGTAVADAGGRHRGDGGVRAPRRLRGGAGRTGEAVEPGGRARRDRGHGADRVAGAAPLDRRRGGGGPSGDLGDGVESVLREPGAG